MSSTKHTPGPWHVETVPTSCGVCHKVGPFPGRRPEDKPRYACLYSDYPGMGDPADAELLANARLIAKAPELLGALEALEAYLVNNIVTDYPTGIDIEGPAFQHARAVIAAATGGAS